MQGVIWAVVNKTNSATPWTSTIEPATSFYNAAMSVANVDFKPSPGQVRMALLLTTSTSNQHMIVELPFCGQIGDRVWLNANNDGKQNETFATGSSAPSNPPQFFDVSQSTATGFKYGAFPPRSPALTTSR